jgi:hypothetical protein
MPQFMCQNGDCENAAYAFYVHPDTGAIMPLCYDCATIFSVGQRNPALETQNLAADVARNGFWVVARNGQYWDDESEMWRENPQFASVFARTDIFTPPEDARWMKLATAMRQYGGYPEEESGHAP